MNTTENAVWIICKSASKMICKTDERMKSKNSNIEVTKP